MSRTLVAFLVVALVSATVLAVVGSALATNRTWTVTKYPGPAKNSVVWDSIKPSAAGKWSVTVSDFGLASLTIDMYKATGSKLALLSSQKLDFSKTPYAIVTSREIHLQAGVQYFFSFTPAGKTGTYAIVVENFGGPQDVPPVASFTVTVINQYNRTVYVDGSASYDPDGTIVSYSWNFGDGTGWIDAGPLTSHAYAADGTYGITLIVTDNAGLTGNTSQLVVIQKPDLFPVASFTVSQAGLFVVTNASASYDPDGTIIRYQWQWGDGSANETSTSPLAAHLYAEPGVYTIFLEVMDNAYLTDVTFQSVSLVSVAPNVSYEFKDFFNVPYGEWWDIRTPLYGDRPVNANCFNATSIADGLCTVADASLPAVEGYPYVNWFPGYMGSLFYNNPSNDPFIYAPYRMHVSGRNVAGYDLAEPVVAPVLNPSAAPGNELFVNWSFDYLDLAAAMSLEDQGCPGYITSANDGLLGHSRIYLSLDTQEARRVLGMPANVKTPDQIGAWLTANVNPSCGTAGSLETALQNWFANQGNGKYDIYSAFLYFYTPFFTNVPAWYVNPDGSMTLTLDMVAWGTEVLLARWFYWGNASYTDNVMNSSAAAGFLGMEAPYMEGLRFSAGFDATSISFELNTAVEYHFKLQAAPGPDGTYRTATNQDHDDVPYWTWGPILGDLITASAPNPYSELSRYAGLTYIHTTPGGINYGLAGPYDYVPATWNLGLAENWSFAFPTGPVLFVDPNLTPIPSNPQGGLVTYLAPLALLGTNPSGYGHWDATMETWVITGPALTGGPPGSPGAYPLAPFGAIFLAPGP